MENVLGTINALPTLLGILLCGVSDAADPLWAQVIYLRLSGLAEIREESAVLRVSVTTGGG